VLAAIATEATKFLASIASNSTTTDRVLLARLAEYHVAPRRD